MTAGITPEQSSACTNMSAAGTDKWTILRDLTDGREAFGLTDRNLSVLSALLSFHPSRELRSEALTVFPSNASLSARLHGMPESTLRRHLAALVDAGVIRRHDSPNGKRYATRDGQGRIDRVFGFDLRPLQLRAAEIHEAAEIARETARLVRRTRQTVVLLLQNALRTMPEATEADSQGVTQLGTRLSELHRLLRRKLDLPALSELETSLRKLLSETGATCEKTSHLSGNDIQNERHQHNTDSDSLGSEEAMKQEDAAAVPLTLVLEAAPDIEHYASRRVTSWHDLTNVAQFIHPMIGITKETWQSARLRLGERTASITLACMLQRFQRIKNPGAYLRKLSMLEDFRVQPMVMALLNDRKVAMNGS